MIDDEHLWRPHRKAIDPAFNSSMLRSFLPCFNEKVKICMNIFEQLADGKASNVYKVWNHLALETILSTSMGLDENIQEARDHPYIENIEK